MDPVSIVASVIAIGQASDRCLELLHKLRLLHDAPVEVNRAINDLSNLKLVLSGLQTTVTQVQHSSVWDQSEGLLLSKAVNELQEQTLGIEKILNSTLLDPAGNVRRFQWATNKAKVEALRHRLRDAVSNAAIQLSQLNVGAHAKIALTVDSIRTMSESIESKQTSHQRSLESRLDRQDSVLHQLLSNYQGEDQTTKIVQRESSQITAYENHNTPIATQITYSGSYNHDSDLQVPVLLSKSWGCAYGCICSCHARRSTTTHIKANKVLKYLFNGYIRQPRICEPCDVATCAQKTQPIATVGFFFPQWFIKRAAIVTLFGEPVPGVTLSFPRLISPYSIILKLIYFGDSLGVNDLFRRGLASPNDIRADTGQGLLSYALAVGRLDISAVLLRTGADPFQPENTRTNSCAADIAWDKLHEHSTTPADRTTIRKLFPEPDLEARSFTRVHETVLGILQERFEVAVRYSRSTINDRDSTGRSPLHWAAKMGDLNKVNSILRCSADPNLQDDTGATPLHYAATTSAVQCVDALVDAGANVNALDKWNGTPLHKAVHYMQNYNLWRLLEAGATVKCNPARTPLHHAAFSHNLDGVKLLLNYGADLESGEGSGSTPLFHGIVTSAHECVGFLLFAGARCDSKTQSMETILHFAAKWADTRTMEVLLNHDGIIGLDVGALDSSGLTAADYFEQRKLITRVPDDLAAAFRALLFRAGQYRDADIFYDAHEKF